LCGEEDLRHRVTCKSYQINLPNFPPIEIQPQWQRYRRKGMMNVPRFKTGVGTEGLPDLVVSSSVGTSRSSILARYVLTDLTNLIADMFASLLLLMGGSMAERSTM
jgi:hypothetical protein